MFDEEFFFDGFCDGIFMLHLQKSFTEYNIAEIWYLGWVFLTWAFKLWPLIFNSCSTRQPGPLCPSYVNIKRSGRVCVRACLRVCVHEKVIKSCFNEKLCIKRNWAQACKGRAYLLWNIIYLIYYSNLMEKEAAGLFNLRLVGPTDVLLLNWLGWVL